MDVVDAKEAVDSRLLKRTLRMFPVRSKSYRQVKRSVRCTNGQITFTIDVGYTRVILAGLSLHFMSFHPNIARLHTSYRVC